MLMLFQHCHSFGNYQNYKYYCPVAKTNSCKSTSIRQLAFDLNNCLNNLIWWVEGEGCRKMGLSLVLFNNFQPLIKAQLPLKLFSWYTYIFFIARIAEKVINPDANYFRYFLWQYIKICVKRRKWHKLGTNIKNTFSPWVYSLVVDTVYSILLLDVLLTAQIKKNRWQDSCSINFVPSLLYYCKI